MNSERRMALDGNNRSRAGSPGDVATRSRGSRIVQRETSGFLESEETRFEPLRFLQSHGVDFPRRANSCVLDADSFVFVSGRQVVVHRFLTGKQPLKKTGSSSTPEAAPHGEGSDYAATFSAGPLRKKPIFLDAIVPDETEATPWINSPPTDDEEPKTLQPSERVEGLRARQTWIRPWHRRRIKTPSCCIMLLEKMGKAGSQPSQLIPTINCWRFASGTNLRHPKEGTSREKKTSQRQSSVGAFSLGEPPIPSPPSFNSPAKQAGETGAEASHHTQEVSSGDFTHSVDRRNPSSPDEDAILSITPASASSPSDAAPSLGASTRKEEASQMSLSSSVLLASVGCAPDFYLTLWDVEQGAALLRFKASAQEVYTVKWSSLFPFQLTTSGARHVKLWNVAKTFTGLKLQGQACKFGAVELSDVQGFVDLADGWLLAGSEYGQLLVWEGCLLKAEVKQAVATVVSSVDAPSEKAGRDESGEPASPAAVSSPGGLPGSLFSSAASSASGPSPAEKTPLWPSSRKRQSVAREEKPNWGGDRGRRASSKFNAVAVAGDGRRGSRKTSLLSSAPGLGPGHLGNGAEGREKDGWREPQIEREVVFKGVSCHAGPICSVFKDPKDPDKIVSAGHDGHIKWWSLEAILTAAEGVDAHKLEAAVPLLRWVSLPDGRGIRHIAVKAPCPSPHANSSAPANWLIEDLAGAFWSYNPVTNALVMLLDLHAADIVGVAPLVSSFADLNAEALATSSSSSSSLSSSPAGIFPERQHAKGLRLAHEALLATAGADGSIRVWRDARKSLPAVSRRWDAAFTALLCLPSRPHRLCCPPHNTSSPSSSPRFSLTPSLDGSSPAGCEGVSASSPPPRKDRVDAWVATGSADGVFRVLGVSAEAISVVYAIKTHAAEIRALACSPDGCGIAALGSDDVVVLLECDGERPVTAFGEENQETKSGDGVRADGPGRRREGRGEPRGRAGDSGGDGENVGRSARGCGESSSPATTAELEATSAPYRVVGYTQAPEKVQEILWSDGEQILLVGETTVLQIFLWREGGKVKATGDTGEARRPERTADSRDGAEKRPHCETIRQLRTPVVRRVVVSLPPSLLRRLHRTRVLLSSSASSSSRRGADTRAERILGEPERNSDSESSSSEDEDAELSPAGACLSGAERRKENGAQGRSSCLPFAITATALLLAAPGDTDYSRSLGETRDESRMRASDSGRSRSDASQSAEESSRGTEGRPSTVVEAGTEQDKQALVSHRHLSPLGERAFTSMYVVGTGALFGFLWRVVVGEECSNSRERPAEALPVSAHRAAAEPARVGPRLEEERPSVRRPWTRGTGEAPEKRGDRRETDSDSGEVASGPKEAEPLSLAPVANLLGLFSQAACRPFQRGGEREDGRRKRRAVCGEISTPSSGLARSRPPSPKGTGSESRGRDGLETPAKKGGAASGGMKPPCRGGKPFKAREEDNDTEDTPIVAVLKKVPDQDLLLLGLTDGRIGIVHLRFLQICFVVPAFDCQFGAVKTLTTAPLHPPMEEYQAAVARALAAGDCAARARQRAAEAAEQAGAAAAHAEAVKNLDLPEAAKAAKAAASRRDAAEATDSAEGAVRTLETHAAAVRAYEAQLLLLAGSEGGTWAKFVVNGAALARAAEAEHAKLTEKVREKVERKRKRRAEREEKEKAFAQQAEEGGVGGEDLPAQANEKDVDDKDDGEDAAVTGDSTRHGRPGTTAKFSTDLSCSWCVDAIVFPRGLRRAAELAATRKAKTLLFPRRSPFLSAGAGEPEVPGHPAAPGERALGAVPMSRAQSEDEKRAAASAREDEGCKEEGAAAVAENTDRGDAKEAEEAETNQPQFAASRLAEDGTGSDVRTFEGVCKPLPHSERDSPARPPRSSASFASVAGTHTSPSLAVWDAVKGAEERDKFLRQTAAEASLEAVADVEKAEAEVDAALAKRREEEEARRNQERQQAQRNDGWKDVTDSAALSLQVRERSVSWKEGPRQEASWEKERTHSRKPRICSQISRYVLGCDAHEILGWCTCLGFQPACGEAIHRERL
ncbi:Coiled-coil protein, related [Neospora caninum Liverpool]|uniref:Coiled-coil protein, related n=1 Tax=Neospora caninum (strain Liverpool) TaxID=572307 RepID=F0VQ77_NEOCL|nr:Coiled-coil protein, related [Neospora caninum Liverpool]CBZ55874.1 Coiled-coil protein, related [Neospora caninum Liverpool]|eukprot:XP_003885900.1 Coiled-coil protein, related [Neospora caninum Liverpool]